LLNDFPHDGVVDTIVTMDQYIPKGNDLPTIGDLARQARVKLLQSIQGYAHDFELAFDDAAENFVGAIIVESPIRRDPAAGIPRLGAYPPEICGDHAA
jgi:hypothetical protein